MGHPVGNFKLDFFQSSLEIIALKILIFKVFVYFTQFLGKFKARYCKFCRRMYSYTK